MKKLLVGVLCVIGLFVATTSYGNEIAFNDKPEITSITLPGKSL